MFVVPIITNNILNIISDDEKRGNTNLKFLLSSKVALFC